MDRRFKIAGTIIASSIALITFLGIAQGWFDSAISRHAVVAAVADFTRGELNSRQISRQTQIDMLKEKCRTGRCSDYERRALENLMIEWEREQQHLDRLRGK